MRKTSSIQETLKWPGELKLATASTLLFSHKDWDKAIVDFLKRAALVFNRAYSLSVAKTEDTRATSRDDNGGYFWGGTFQYGEQEHFIQVNYFGNQAEQMMYPMPLYERRTYLVKGIKQNLRLTCSYEEYAASLSYIILTLDIEGTLVQTSKIQRLFNKYFSTAYTKSSKKVYLENNQ